MADLIVSLKGREIRRYALVKSETTIGRDPTNDVVIDNLGVSRTHAAVVRAGHGFIARDLGGRNGLFVNGQLATAHYLQHGDTLQIGKFDVTLSAVGEARVYAASPVETSVFDQNDRARVLDAVAVMRDARSNPPPPSALPNQEAQDARVRALEHEVRSLRRALYAAAVLIVLLLVEVVAVIINVVR
jgi:pSer/pThr/pTyr-binding forkhead associated (FHA) protein